MSLRKDDTVMVIAGKEKGKTGKVLRILHEKNRAFIERVNMVKRHAKPSKTNAQGGILEKEASIHLSNLMYYCDKCSKPVRLGMKLVAEGKKIRVCRKCNSEK